MAKCSLTASIALLFVLVLEAFSSPVGFSDNHIDNRSRGRNIWPRPIKEDRVIWSTHTLRPDQGQTKPDAGRPEHKEKPVEIINTDTYTGLQQQHLSGQSTNNRKNDKLVESTRIKRKAELACERYRNSFNSERKQAYSSLPTMPGEFPYMGALAFKFVGSDQWSFQCGAALISENFALAPAHCLKRPDHRKPYFLRLGKTTLQNSEDGAKACDVGISKVIIHPGYSGKHKFDDLAILQLNTSLKFTDFVHPVCLNMAPEENTNADKFIAMGWGKLFDESNADALFKVEVNRIARPYCNEMYKKIKKSSKGILESQVCVRAEHIDPKKCEGNSGGPLELKGQGGKTVLYGMGSIYAGCSAEQPFVYTNISHYLDWIESIVW